MSTQAIVANFPDADLIPSNVVDGVEIYGVTGTAVVGAIPGSGPADFFFGFDAAEGMQMQTSCLISCGTYQTVDALYFIYGMSTGATNAAVFASSILTIAKYDKTTLAVTMYRSGPIMTSQRTSGVLNQELKEGSGVIYYRSYYDTPSVTNHISFDTATDTFGTFQASGSFNVDNYGVATLITSTTSPLTNLPVQGNYPEGTAGSGAGSAMTNSESYLGDTYSTAVQAFTGSGTNAGAERIHMSAYGIALKA